MRTLVFGSLLLFGVHHCDEAEYMGTVLKIGDDRLVGQIDFETEQDDWILKNMKIIDTNNSKDNINNIPGEGHVAMPQVSMSGDDQGQVSTMFNIPVLSRVALEFNVYVSGFDPQFESLFSTNPDLIISLTEVNASSIKNLANLARLNPQNNIWNKYRTEIESEGSQELWTISLKLRNGGGVIALDGVSIEIVPLVGENKETTENNTMNEKEDDVRTTNGTENKAGIPSNDSTTQRNNISETTHHPENKTNNSSSLESPEIVPAEPTELTIETKTEVPVNDDNVKNATNVNTTLPTTNMTADNISSFSSGDTSMYGYSGEVVLICLAVLFIILFLGTVFKYHRLKSHMGDYSLDQGGDRQFRQENQGSEVQMSYRVDD